MDQPLQVAAQTTPARLTSRGRGHYVRLLHERGAAVKPGECWLIGLPALPFADTGGAAAKDRWVWLGPDSKIFSATAPLPNWPAGLYPGQIEDEQLGVGDDRRCALNEGLRAHIGDQSFRVALLDPEQANSLPRIAPARLTPELKFNHYLRYLVAAGGSVPNGTTAVLGLRGVDPEGLRHHSGINQGGYDDTYVVLRRDARGKASVREFLGSSHAGRADDPDAPPSGTAQIRPGRYLARPDGRHHGMECWAVRDRAGRNWIPAWRDADSDGLISPEEKATSTFATHILFHNGLHLDRCSSIGCLTLKPHDFERFAATVGPKTRFEFTLIDANQPLDVSTVRYRLGSSRGGKPIWMYELGQGPKTALYFASIHGDEPVGTDLLDRLQKYFEENPEQLNGWRVRLIPCVNPDSLGKRRGNSRGVDLNRNFPAAWKRSMVHNGEYSGSGPLSEPESRTVYDAVLGLGTGPAHRPSRILSIHQHRGVGAGGGLLDGDGPAHLLVARLLEAGQGRFKCEKIADSQGRLRIPGSFGTWVSSPAVKIPTITYELSHDDRSPQANWETNLPLFKAFLDTLE